MSNRKARPICDSCNDTHFMELEQGQVPCTHCPVPCPECRDRGIGAFCQTTPCACGCHKLSREIGLSVEVKRRLLQRWSAMLLSDLNRDGFWECVASCSDADPGSKQMKDAIADFVRSEAGTLAARSRTTA